MDHQYLHMIIAPLVKQPKCELPMSTLCTLDVYVDLSLNNEDKLMRGFIVSKMKCSANIIDSLEAKFFNLFSNTRPNLSVCKNA
jgi:hypothetical protein